MMKILLTLGFLAVVSASPTSNANKDANAQGYKDQYCTDPRTMRKHAAYTEWADAYSCTRHRCQPGGRNLAIYTVGCKRVEAPESAIECEEVVEDTNMQFPFCCTRLRCLVVVRGEVWTRVLGQPWEVLPAAPWSHMYKMKKPPPADTTFQPKIAEQGPIYELSEAESDTNTNDKQQRSGRKQNPTDSPDCNEVVPRASGSAAPTPDIVFPPQIALSTNSEKDSHSKRPREDPLTRRQTHTEKTGISWQDQTHDSDSDTEHKRVRKTTESSGHFFEKEEGAEHRDGEIQEVEDNAVPTEKPQTPDASEEKFYGNAFIQKDVPQKSTPKESHHHEKAWTDIPQNQWNEHEGMDVESRAHVMELRYTQEPTARRELVPQEPEKERKEEKHEKSSNLQALVDAIGSRMKDIENVVQKMSEKVHQTKRPTAPTAAGSSEKRAAVIETDFSKRHRVELEKPLKSKHEQERGDHDHESMKPSEDHFKQRAHKVAIMKGRGGITQPSKRRTVYHHDVRLTKNDVRTPSKAQIGKNHKDKSKKSKVNQKYSKAQISHHP